MELEKKKYELALRTLYNFATKAASGFFPSEMSVIEANGMIKELVHKATPMKPNRVNRYCGRCDINRLIKGNDNYCSVCGQKIDWSDHNE